MGRRGNGEGSISRRGDGLYMGRYTVETATGAKRKTLYGKTRSEVAEKLTKAMADRDGGMVFDAGKLTVGDYLTGWLSDSVRGSVRASTLDSYSRLIRAHAIPVVGGIKLKNLTPPHLRRLYRSRLDGEEGCTGLSPRTVQYLHTVLKRAMKQAVRDGLIPRNPCEAVDPPQVRREEIKPLSREQVRILFAAARGDRLEALYIVAVTTGLRQGELLGLKWDDVDLSEATGTLQVRRTLAAVKNGSPIFTAPKTAKSRRRIKLSTGAVAALKAHRKRQLEERIQKAGFWSDHGLVFPSEAGTPLSRHNLTRRWKKLLTRAGLPYTTRFHDLRHTCATLLLSRSVHPKIVQELLGHATISITLDTYSHLLEGMGDAAAGAMDDALKEDPEVDPVTGQEAL